MAWDAKWSNIIVEIDYVFVINDICSSLREQLHRGLILIIRQLYRCEWRVAFEQIPGEANYATG